MNAIKNRNTTGVAWSAIEKFGIQGSQFVVTLILARMLVPADYGLIAMLSIFYVVATALIDSGMAQALIQRQHRSEEDFTTALIFNVIVALAIYGIIYISAPAIAHFYSSPQLCDVARVYSLVLIINSLGVVQQAIITIELDFRRQAIASFTGIIIGGCVAVAMAYRGWGVWSLVCQQIISDSIRVLIIWIIARWRPTGRFSYRSFIELARFGSKIMTSGLIHVIYVNLYPLIIGRHFASSELGLFNRATTIGALPSSNISTIVDRALYPVLCSRQEECNSSAETLHRYLRVVCFVVFPMMIGISILSTPTIEVLLGSEWSGAAPLLRIIALAYMWDPAMKFIGSFIKSQGRSSEFLRAETLKKIAGFGILFATIPFGIEVMVQGLILYALVDLSIVTLFARRITPLIGYRQIFLLLSPILLMSGVMGLCVWWVSTLTAQFGSAVELIAGVATGIIAYLLLATILRREELHLIINTIRSYIKK